MFSEYWGSLIVRGVIFVIVGLLPFAFALGIRAEKFNKKRGGIYLLAILLIVLLVPIPMRYKDGGTLELNAPLYRVIKWKAMGIYSKTYDDHIDDYWLEKLEFQLIPRNMKSIDELKDEYRAKLENGEEVKGVHIYRGEFVSLENNTPAPTDIASAKPTSVPETVPTQKVTPTAEPTDEPTPTPEPVPGPDELPIESVFIYYPELFPVIDSSTARKPITEAIYMELNGVNSVAADNPLCSKTHGAWLNLADKKADIVFLVAPTEEEESYFREKKVNIEMKPYGYDGLGFIVSPECPVKSLTSAQIRGIYECTVTNWKQVGGPDADIHPYFRDDQSGSQRLFENFLWPDGDAPDFTSMLDRFYFADDMSSITEEVARDPYAIGYNIVSYLNLEYEDYIMTVAVDGAKPNTDTFKDHSYPFITTAYVAIRADEAPNSPARRIYDWIGSEMSIQKIESNSSLAVAVGDSEFLIYDGVSQAYDYAGRESAGDKTAKLQANAVLANEAVYASFDFDKDYVYPDDFAGTYIEYDILYVAVTDQQAIDRYAEITKRSPFVRYAVVNNSYNYLTDCVREYAASIKDDYRVKSCGVDARNNKGVIKLEPGDYERFCDNNIEYFNDYDSSIYISDKDMWIYVLPEG